MTAARIVAYDPARHGDGAWQVVRDVFAEYGFPFDEHGYDADVLRPHEHYRGGWFWVAEDNGGRVVGCVGLSEEPSGSTSEEPSGSTSEEPGVEPRPTEGGDPGVNPHPEPEDQRRPLPVPGRANETAAGDADLRRKFYSSPSTYDAATSEFATRFELHRLYVLPAARGSALGERLVRTVIAAAREANARELVLYSDIAFTHAHRLYRRCGFRNHRFRYAPDPWQSREWGFTLDLEPAGDGEPRAAGGGYR